MFKPLVALALFLALAMPAAAQETDDYAPYVDAIVSDDLSALPAPVRAMYDQLLAAAESGDIERLGRLYDAQDVPPTISYGEVGDAVATFKRNSADGEGADVLAALEKLLHVSYAIIGASSDDPSYVWPALFVADLTDLSKAQKAELRSLVDEETYQSMLEFGGWYDYRLFIGKDGDWQAFVAGD